VAVSLPSNGSSVVSCPANTTNPEDTSRYFRCLWKNSFSFPCCKILQLNSEGDVVWNAVQPGGLQQIGFTYYDRITVVCSSNGSSVISKLSCTDATELGTPADILDACGRTVSASLLGQDAQRQH
jgi:hypothetical protein